ncbi:MAG: hypothetical protein AB1733_06785 [Thermodesulfobacteriota bacterium]
MSEKKWTAEKVHKELYDVRTKLFVIAKVLETGSLNLREHPEWTLVIEPLLKEVVQYAEQIKSHAAAEEESGPKEDKQDKEDE